MFQPFVAESLFFREAVPSIGMIEPFSFRMQALLLAGWAVCAFECFAWVHWVSSSFRSWGIFGYPATVRSSHGKWGHSRDQCPHKDTWLSSRNPRKFLLYSSSLFACMPSACRLCEHYGRIGLPFILPDLLLSPALPEIVEGPDFCVIRNAGLCTRFDP